MASPYEIVELAKKTGKIEKGINEVTKAIERGTAKLVVYADDVSPKEIIQHLPVLCKEKNIMCQNVDNKKKLGTSAGIGVPCSAIAIIEPGDALKFLSEKDSKEEKSKKAKK